MSSGVIGYDFHISENQLSSKVSQGIALTVIRAQIGRKDQNDCDESQRLKRVCPGLSAVVGLSQVVCLRGNFKKMARYQSKATGGTLI